MTWRKLKGINKNDRNYLTKNLWFDWRLIIDAWWFVEMQSLWLECGGFFPSEHNFACNSSWPSGLCNGIRRPTMIWLQDKRIRNACNVIQKAVNKGTEPTSELAWIKIGIMLVYLVEHVYIDCIHCETKKSRKKILGLQHFWNFTFYLTHNFYFGQNTVIVSYFQKWDYTLRCLKDFFKIQMLLKHCQYKKPWWNLKMITFVILESEVPH